MSVTPKTKGEQMLLPPRDWKWLLEKGKDLDIRPGEPWYCVTTHPEREIDVARRLHELGVHFFMPLLVEDAAAKRVRPLWSRYVYARFSDRLWPYVKSYKGVAKIIKLRDQASLLNELTPIGLLNRNEEEFYVGQKVLVKAGAFTGQVGVVEELERTGHDIVVNLRAHNPAVKASASLPRQTLSAYGVEERRGRLVVIDEQPYVSSPRASEIKERRQNCSALLETVRTFNAELIRSIARRPNLVYNLAPRAFEQLVADILADMGYDVQLTPETHDHGRDILAVFTLPHGKVLTVVECKRNAPDRPVGVDIVQRLLWVMNEQDRANGGLIATTSYFSPEAKSLEKQYAWRLKLKDFSGISDWLRAYGTWEQRADSRLWLPAASA